MRGAATRMRGISTEDYLPSADCFVANGCGPDSAVFFSRAIDARELRLLKPAAISWPADGPQQVVFGCGFFSPGSLQFAVSNYWLKAFFSASAAICSAAFALSTTAPIPKNSCVTPAYVFCWTWTPAALIL